MVCIRFWRNGIFTRSKSTSVSVICAWNLASKPHRNGHLLTTWLIQSTGIARNATKHPPAVRPVCQSLNKNLEPTTIAKKKQIRRGSSTLSLQSSQSSWITSPGTAMLLIRHVWCPYFSCSRRFLQGLNQWIEWFLGGGDHLQLSDNADDVRRPLISRECYMRCSIQRRISKTQSNHRVSSIIGDFVKESVSFALVAALALSNFTLIVSVRVIILRAKISIYVVHVRGRTNPARI